MINYTESPYLSSAAREYFAAQDYESVEFQSWYQPLMHGFMPPQTPFEVELVRAMKIHLTLYWNRPSKQVQ